MDIHPFQARPGRSEWHEHETYKSMIAYGQGMLRFCLIVNGGSIIAILTFIGNLAAKDKPLLHMTWAITFFLLGILFAGAASCTAYMTQLRLFRETVDGKTSIGVKTHEWWLWRTVGLIVCSIGTFAVGSLIAIAELS